MEKIKHYEIDVKMALSGTKDMQNKLQRIMATVPELRSRFQELGIDKVFNKQLDTMVNGAITKFNKLENAMKMLKTPESFNISGDEASANLIDSYKEMLQIMARTNIEMERLSQHSKSAFSAQEDDIQKTITLLDNNKIKIKGLTDLYVEAGIKAEAANSVAPLAKFNRELDARTQKLLKIRELLGTMKNLNLNSAEAKDYQRSLEGIYMALKDFSIPLKEAETVMKGLKVNPKLLADMQEFGKYTAGLKKDLISSQNAMNKNSTAYKEMGVFLKQIAAEQDKVTKGGKDEFAVAKKNVSLIEQRYKTYITLNTQADRLTQNMANNDALAKETKAAITLIVEELRKAAVEQFDLTKSSQEHNNVLKKALDYEALINKNLKEKVTVEQKLLAIQRKTKTQLEDIHRLMKSKKSYATTESLKAASEEAKRLESFLDDINAKLTKVRSVGTVDGKLDEASLAKVRGEAEKLTQEFANTNSRVKEVKANLSELSSTKWGANILKRAVAYASMYAGIYEVISLMRNGIGAVVEFDTQMRTIEAVFDVTAGTAKNLTQDLMNLGRAWGGSVTDINDAALALGRAGIATEKVGEATEVVIKMAKLTGDSIAVSASAVITYQQVFGATHPVLKEVGDQLAYVANQSRLSTQDIGTFSNYALAAAKAAGISMEAINAMATSFSNAGVNASTIGTQIRRFSSLMKDNSTAAVEFFQKLGTTQDAFAAQMQAGKKSADEAMTWIAKRLKSLSNSEFQKTIKGMDILASNSITLLRNNADEFLRHFTTLNEGVQGEIDKANLISDGYQASFEKMKVAASDAFIKLSETAAPAIQKLLDGMAEFFDYIKNNSAEVVRTLNTIVDVAKWTALGVGIFKIVNYIDTFRKSTSLANVAVVAFAGRVGQLATAFWAVTAGVRAFLASNPIGWAILGVTAIGGVVASMVDYGDSIDEVAKKTDKFKDLQSQSEVIEKRVSKTRTELGQVMKLLNDSTHKATEEEFRRAAALETSIAQDQKSLALLKEKQKVQELHSQITVKENRKSIIVEEIKLAEADGNIKLVQSLKRRHKRLEEDVGRIEVKVALAESKSTYIADVTELVRNYEAELQRLNEMKSDKNVPLERITQWNKVLDVYKTRLKEVYNIDINAFKGKDLEVELEKYLNTVKGKLAASEAYLKVNTKIPPEAKATLEAEIKTLKAIIADNGASANDLFGKVNLDTVAKFGQAIANQIKAGMDVVPQFDSFINQYNEAMSKITVSTTYTATTLNILLQKAIDSIDTSKLGEGFTQLIAQVKQAEADFSSATTPKDKQVAVTNLNNALAKLRNEYKGVADEAIKATEKIATHYNDANNSVQSLSGELGKVTKAMYGNGDAAAASAKKMITTLSGVLADTNKVNMSYAQINNKIASGVDLTWQMRNAGLSAEQATQLQKKALIELKDINEQLIALYQAYEGLQSNAFGMSVEQNKAATKAVVETLQKLATKASNVNNNFKATVPIIHKVRKHAAHAAKSAENHAEQVERAQRAFKKLEAGYRAILGDNTLANKLGLEAELMQIDELGKKAKAAKSKIQELKDLFLEGKQKENNKELSSNTLAQFASGDVQELIGIRKNFEERIVAEKEYYQKRFGLINQQEELIKERLDNGKITQAEYDDAHRALELQKHADYRAQQFGIDQAYYMKLANETQQGLATVGDIMDNLQKAGILKGKAWAKVMQGIRVAETIMATYQNAVLAYQAGLETGGPAGMAVGAAYAAVVISAGMAQVAQIKSQKFHTGGYTDKPLSSGVGGLKDDEINAVLKKGEYVLTQNEVASIKAANKRNTAAPTPTEKQDTNKSESSSLQTRELAQLADSLKSEIVIVNSQDPAVIESWATSRRGREVISNIING